MPKTKPFTHIIPDAHYRCEGVDLGTEKVAEIHFRDPEGGFLPPEQLFFLTIIDRKGDSECTGFFCQSCTLAYNLKTSGKMTLREAIRSRLELAQQKAAHEILKATGC